MIVPPMILVSFDHLWHISAVWPDGDELSHSFKYDGPDFNQGWRLVGSQVLGWLDSRDDEGGEA